MPSIEDVLQTRCSGVGMQKSAPLGGSASWKAHLFHGLRLGGLEHEAVIMLSTAVPEITGQCTVAIRRGM